MKYLDSFLPKDALLDAVILLISMFFIEIGSLCLRNFCFSISISPKLIELKNSYIFKIYNFLLFYNTPLFSVKTAFCKNSIASTLLIKVIIQ